MEWHLLQISWMHNELMYKLHCYHMTGKLSMKSDSRPFVVWGEQSAATLVALCHYLIHDFTFRTNVKVSGIKNCLCIIRNTLPRKSDCIQIITHVYKHTIHVQFYKYTFLAQYFTSTSAPLVRWSASQVHIVLHCCYKGKYFYTQVMFSGLLI